MQTKHCWARRTVFYHIYPLGFTGAPIVGSGTGASNRLLKILDWVEHLKSLHVGAVYLGPVFHSETHGYDPIDFCKIDPRLGDENCFRQVCDTLHAEGIRIILEAVFDHVGRDFPQFVDLQENVRQSPYDQWFCGVDFDQTSPYNDPFSYEGFHGHYNLIRLNLTNPETAQYFLDVVEYWMDHFGIDGIRLNGAERLDENFLSALRRRTSSKNPEFFLLGEMSMGDYRRRMSEELLHSITNYDIRKVLVSCHNTHSYLEMSWLLEQQFGKQGMYSGELLYNFADNHDMNRIASMLQDPAYLPNLYTILYTIPGIPSLYYGSEWGLTGVRDRSSDNMLRPCLDLNAIPSPNEELLRHLQILGALYQECPALWEGDCRVLQATDETLVFRRAASTQIAYIALNLSREPLEVSFEIQGDCLTDRLHDQYFEAVRHKAKISVPACGSRILTESVSTQSCPVGACGGYPLAAEISNRDHSCV